MFALIQFQFAIIIAFIIHDAFAAVCTVTVPPNPLTAVGLATAYILQAGCSMAVPGQEVFVEGAIYDPYTNTVSVYNPLVIDFGTTAAALPVVPSLPTGAVVGLWFGTNADGLILIGDLKGGNCVNGLTVGGLTDPFGQFAYCNAATFFASAANVVLPPLGTATDGQPCLTTRDFALVDKAQSDGVATQYILTTEKKTAQNTLANRNTLNVSSILENGGDTRLLALLDHIMACFPFTGRDLAEQSVASFVPSLALNELAAARLQARPQATVPDNDPMVLLGGGPDKGKLAQYRIGVNQPVGVSASTTDYCRNYSAIAPPRFLLNEAVWLRLPSPDPAFGNSLFTFLAARFENSFGPNGLNCTGLGMTPPISTVTDIHGVAVSATVTLPTTSSPSPEPSTAPSKSPTLRPTDSTAQAGADTIPQGGAIGIGIAIGASPLILGGLGLVFLRWRNGKTALRNEGSCPAMSPPSSASHLSRGNGESRLITKVRKAGPVIRKPTNNN